MPFLVYKRCSEICRAELKCCSSGANLDNENGQKPLVSRTEINWFFSFIAKDFHKKVSKSIFGGKNPVWKAVALRVSFMSGKWRSICFKDNLKVYNFKWLWEFISGGRLPIHFMLQLLVISAETCNLIAFKRTINLSWKQKILSC